VFICTTVAQQRFGGFDRLRSVAVRFLQLPGVCSEKCKWFRSVMVAAIWLGISYSSAYAHGGIAGPDELGPPVITAVALGLGGYWTVMLWPSRKNFRAGPKQTRRSQTRLTRRVTRSY
jgi:hypothetical protein